jgi:hypothetical protein
MSIGTPRGSPHNQISTKLILSKFLQTWSREPNQQTRSRPLIHTQAYPPSATPSAIQNISKFLERISQVELTSLSPTSHDSPSSHDNSTYKLLNSTCSVQSTSCQNYLQFLESDQIKNPTKNIEGCSLKGPLQLAKMVWYTTPHASPYHYLTSTTSRVCSYKMNPFSRWVEILKMLSLFYQEYGSTIYRISLTSSKEDTWKSWNSQTRLCGHNSETHLDTALGDSTRASSSFNYANVFICAHNCRVNHIVQPLFQCQAPIPLKLDSSSWLETGFMLKKKVTNICIT